MNAYIPQLTLQSCWAFFKNQKGEWMPQQSSHHFDDGIVCYSSSKAPVMSTSESSKTLYYCWYLTHVSLVAYSSDFLPNFQLVISLFLMPIKCIVSSYTNISLDSHLYLHTFNTYTICTQNNMCHTSVI